MIPRRKHPAYTRPRATVNGAVHIHTRSNQNVRDWRNRPRATINGAVPVHTCPNQNARDWRNRPRANADGAAAPTRKEIIDQLLIDELSFYLMLFVSRSSNDGLLAVYRYRKKGIDKLIYRIKSLKNGDDELSNQAIEMVIRRLSFIRTLCIDGCHDD